MNLLNLIEGWIIVYEESNAYKLRVYKSKLIIIYVSIEGCYKGTWGNNCTADCPDECIDRHCFPNNGSCVWGCDAQMCFHGECDSKTDLCTKGCVAGRGGRYCTFCRYTQ